MPAPIIDTPRLRLRELEAGDAGFILSLLNDPDFLLHIGDRQVRDLEGALRYINDGPRASYARHGFGLWLVETRDAGTPTGICGLLQRDTLPHPDLGYAFLPAFRGQGLAREAAQASLRYAFEVARMTRVLAIVSQANSASTRLLESLGFAARAPEEINGEMLLVYAIDQAP